MLRTRISRIAATAENSAREFMMVRQNPELLAELPVQSEALCLYAIHNRSVFRHHPWYDIRTSNRTPAIELLTAATAPRVTLTEIMAHKKPLPETTVAAVFANRLGLYDKIPEMYKTHGIQQMYNELCELERKAYRWGLGVH